MTDKLYFYKAITLITGTVIGAGVFGIPYAVSKAGFKIGLLHLVLVGTFVTLMTLFMAEVVLRTKETRQFTGLAEKYLGQPGKWIMFTSMVFGIYGALIAYLTGVGSSLAHLLGGSPIFYTIIFLAIAAPIVFFGLNAISKVELGLSAIVISLFILIIFSLVPKINFSNFSSVDLSQAMTPYGVILFACLGYTVIPEVELLLKKNKKKMFSAIMIAMTIALSLYALLTFSTVGVYGSEVAEIVVDSLSGRMNIIGSIVVILAMSTAFLTLSMVLRHIFSIDLKMNNNLAWVLVCFLPLAIIIFISPSFITAVELTGTYSGGLAGILCALMVKEARKKGDDKPTFVVPGGNPLIYLTIAVFVFGMVHQTLSLFGVL